MAFTKKDLKYTHYTWKVDGGDNPNYRGKLDRMKLDRQEGYEVLSFANAYSQANLFSPQVSDLHKLEGMLLNKVPSTMVMKDEIAEFINSKW